MNKIMVNLFAFLGVYLILMLPVTYAQSVSSVISYEEDSNLMGNILAKIPTYLLEFVDIIKLVIENFLNSIAPSVNAQSCNPGCDGDGVPETGEQPLSCCYDYNGCPASTDYCDLTISTPSLSCGICKPKSDISLSSPSLQTTNFQNCQVTHATNVTFSISNHPSTDILFSTKKLVLNSGLNNVTLGQCTIINDLGSFKTYKCDVTIPTFSCGSGLVSITDNSIELKISVIDAQHTSALETMTSALSDITIQSYTCGDGNFQPEYGEVCCYESGCSSTQYCDIESTPNTGSCKTLPSDFDLIITPTSTLSFDHYADADNKVDLDLQIFDLPSNAIVNTPTCVSSCLEGCDSTCSVTCNSGSLSGSLYISSCTLSFVINNYVADQRYNLDPTITTKIDYSNGSSSLSTDLVAVDVFRISMDTSVCGNGIPEYNELSNNCCYDVVCSSGFCDWISGSEGEDRCRNNLPSVSIENIQDNIETTIYLAGPFNQGGFQYWENRTRSTSFIMESKISNLPDSVKWNFVNATCEFDNIDCSMSKINRTIFETAFGKHAIVYYKITIPETIYNPIPPDKIILKNGIVTFSVAYNNGSNILSNEFIHSVQDIEIRIIPQCGNGIDESNLGETACCTDAGCSTGSTCIGNALNDLCVNPSVSSLIVAVPDQTCTIKRYGSECVLGTTEFAVEFYNLDSDISLIRGYYRLDDGNQRPLVGCAQEVNYNGSFESYSCRISEEIGETEVGVTQHILNVTFDVNFGGGVTSTLNSIDTFRVNTVKDENLVSCQNRVSQFENMEAEMEDIINWFERKATLYLIITAALAAGCVICIIWCQKAAKYLCLGALVTGVAACAYNKIADDGSIYQEQIESVRKKKDQFNDLCRPHNITTSGETMEDKLNAIDREDNFQKELADKDKYRTQLSAACLIGVTVGVAYGPKSLGGGNAKTTEWN